MSKLHQQRKKLNAEEVASIILAAASGDEEIHSDDEPEFCDEEHNESGCRDSDSEISNDSDEEYTFVSESENGDCTRAEHTVDKKGRQWSTKSPHPASFRGKNIFRFHSGSLLAKSSPKEFFKNFFDETLVRNIASYTNERLEKDVNDSQRQHDCIDHEVTIDEIYGYMGILLMLGILKKKDVEIDEIWCEKDDAIHRIPWVLCTMSRQRFKLLSRYLTFDDIYTRTDRCIDDPKFYKCREMANCLKKKCLSSCEPGQHLSVDENLYPFRGRCQFRQYMPSKPNKYGMKVWQLVDSVTRYLVNFDFYLGKEGNNTAKELGKNVVLRLTKPFRNTSRNVTTDNYFTSTSLAEELWENGLTIVGTVKKGRKEVFPQLYPSKDREEHSTRFYFSDYMTFVSYVPKRRRVVNVLTTQHHDKRISDIKKKPEVILYYNATMGGSDTIDQIMMANSCRRTTNRWTLRIFHYLIDVSVCNSFALMKMTHSESELNSLLGTERSQRRTFIEKLAIELMAPEVEHRFERYRTAKGLSKSLQTCFSKLGHTFALDADESSSFRTSGRCYLCKDRKSRNKCNNCKRFVCKEHSNCVHICDPACQSSM